MAGDEKKGFAMMVVVVMGFRFVGWKWDGEKTMGMLRSLSERLGFWAIPLCVLAHTLTLAFCLPYAVFFEARASVLFGFFPAVLYVFSAKLLAAALSFSIGRSSKMLY